MAAAGYDTTSCRGKAATLAGTGRPHALQENTTGRAHSTRQSRVLRPCRAQFGSSGAQLTREMNEMLFAS